VDNKDLYKLLGLPREASQHDIQNTQRKLVPDPTCILLIACSKRRCDKKVDMSFREDQSFGSSRIECTQAVREV